MVHIKHFKWLKEIDDHYFNAKVHLLLFNVFPCMACMYGCVVILAYLVYYLTYLNNYILCYISKCCIIRSVAMHKILLIYIG